MDKVESVVAQDLVFPDAPDFMAEPVNFSASEMAEMCQFMLPIWNKKRYAQEDALFIGDEFILDD
jgi:hypothetical protein